MSDTPQARDARGRQPERTPPAPPAPPERISSRELFKDRTSVEIDHEGRIYQLRITQFGKLILTA